MQITTCKDKKQHQKDQGASARFCNKSAICALEETHRKMFARFLESHQDKKLVITTHKRADADGICAAFVLSKLLPNAVIAFQDEPYIEAVAVMRRLGIEFKLLKEVESANLNGLVVVDASSSWRIPAVDLSQQKKLPILLVLDHHERNNIDVQGEFNIIQSSAGSTCALLYSLLPQEIIRGDIALALFVGAVSDVGKYGKLENIQTLVDFLAARSGCPKTELEKYVNPKLTADMELAVQNAIRNAQWIHYRGYNIRVAVVALAIQPYVADELLNSKESNGTNGKCDISFVIQKVGGNECDSSLRVGEGVGLDASILAHEIGIRLSGHGGGHQKKAGVITHATAEETQYVGLEVIKAALVSA